MGIPAVFSVFDGSEHLPSILAGISFLFVDWCSLLKGAHMTSFDLSGLDSYITDSDIEGDVGVWLKFPGDRRVRVLRAGGSNKRFSRSFSRVVKPYRRQLDRGTLDPEKSEELMLEVYLDAVIMDWEGFKDKKGRDIPFSRGSAREFFIAVPEMFSEIQSIASEAATFQEREAEEVANDLGES